MYPARAFKARTRMKLAKMHENCMMYIIFANLIYKYTEMAKIQYEHVNCTVHTLSQMHETRKIKISKRDFPQNPSPPIPPPQEKHSEL